MMEMPTRVLVESRPADGGNGYEVLYLRQVLERTVVPDLYRFDGRDERGVATLVRASGLTAVARATAAANSLISKISTKTSPPRSMPSSRIAQH